MVSMITKIQLTYVEVRIFRHFIITVMKEGITVIPEYNADLRDIAETYFADRPFGYITLRKYSYSVDPLVYLETSKISNLVAFAVVATEGIKGSNVQIEKLFLQQPFKHFRSLKNAEKWVLEMVENSGFISK